MDRETRKFNTPSGIEIEIKTYLTGGEQRQIDSILIDNMEVNVETKTTQLPNKKSKAEIIYQQENKLIELMVVGIAGNKENIIEKILAMKTADYNFIIQEINIASSGGLDTKKKI